MKARKSLSKMTRFEVFKRDGFACQYCGAHPPGALLHVDHVVPVAEGGGNDIDNLVTACQGCNLGKGARSLEMVPQSLKDKAAEVAEREAQIAAYAEVMEARRARREEDTWDVCQVWMDQFHKDSINKGYFASVGQFVDQLGKHECMDAMELAVARKPYVQGVAFKYFCGICWNKIKGVR